MPYSIKFTNFSKAQWVRSVSGSTVDVALQNLTKSPGSHLMKGSGVEQIAADENAITSNLVSGSIDLHCCWLDPATGQRFGIQLWVPIHVFGIGKAPYWYVMSDCGDIRAEPTWISSGQEPSEVYEWKNLNGFDIRAEPTAAHSSLEISVTIKNSQN